MTGNTQLLARELPAEHPGQRRIGRILESARRIERIVAQMNRITRYQVREFSPGMFELALEKVAEAEPPAAGPAETG